MDHEGSAMVVPIVSRESNALVIEWNRFVWRWFLRRIPNSKKGNNSLISSPHLCLATLTAYVLSLGRAVHTFQLSELADRYSKGAYKVKDVEG